MKIKSILLVAFVMIMSANVNAATTNFSGAISWVNPISSSGIFYPTVIGDNFIGALDDVTGSGFISNGITTVTLSCCSLFSRDVPYVIYNDFVLSAEYATFYNTVIGAPVFSAGDTIDRYDLAGRASPPDGDILETNLIYLFDSSAFVDESPDNYPFTEDPLYTLFGIYEKNFPDLEYFNVAGLVNPVPIPAAAWLFSSGLLGLIGLARRKKA